MASDFFNQLVTEEAKVANIDTELVDYTYSVVFASSRLEKTGTAITFVMKKPIEMSDNTADAISSSLLSTLDTENIEVVDNILNQLKLSINKPVAKKKVKVGFA